MRSKKKIRIGLDFDGVITYNPIRIARLAVSLVKHKILRKRKLSFFEPKNQWQRKIYYLGVVIPSIWPARGTRLLKILTKSDKYEFYLLTGRYGFTQKETYAWLKKHHLKEVFTKIYINRNNEQPHLFKRRIINSNKFDYFVEDNLDIVRDLNARKSKVKILWIYNILDGWRNYEYKYPFLERALEEIIKNESPD